MNAQQMQRMEFDSGFIAALDQSGGSTARALALYGVAADDDSGDAGMFDRMHAMRSRIVTSAAFRGDRVLAAILFRDTLERQFDGRDAADYLWTVKHVIPFLKVDEGLEEQVDGVRLMKPMPDLEATLARAKVKGVFGTKMRSVIALADAGGIERLVDQQFDVARRIRSWGLMPILEPEIDIASPQKAEAEALLRTALRDHLRRLDGTRRIMLKLTLPDLDGSYSEFVAHRQVLRVAGLSGGYTRARANQLLARNPGVIASFSRALTEGLSTHQSDEDFEASLRASIESIYTASTAMPFSHAD